MNWSQLLVWIIVGGLSGTIAGRILQRKKEGFGFWRNLGLGMAGALLGGGLFELLGIDLGLGVLEITFEDLLSAFLGSLLFAISWWLVLKIRSRRDGAIHD